MKRNEKSNAAKMTLREAFEKFYPKDELAERTVAKMRYDLLRFERLTKNGKMPISKITDEVLEDFRKALLEKHTAPSANSTRTALRAIFRRLGPPITGNPTGLGIISKIPYMRPSKVVRGLPRRVSQEDLSMWYLACEQMQSPKTGFPAPWFWQTFLVVAYFSGLRKSDLFGIRFGDLDLDGGTLLFTARKTSKPMRLPLHPCVVEHIRRIEQPKREYLFESSIKASGSFNQRFDWICRKAGIERFTCHDIRRVAASECCRAAGNNRGMAAVLLQHAAFDVTATYVNQMEELGEAIAKMRVPLAFKHGPRQAERQLAKQREAAQSMMKAAQFSPPTFPDPAEWQFHNVGFIFRGHHVHMEGGALRILKAIALSPMHSCTVEELKAVVWPDGNFGSFRTIQGRICDAISTIRERLRHVLLLPDSFNPCPCIERGNGGRWTLYVPGSVGSV